MVITVLTSHLQELMQLKLQISCEHVLKGFRVKKGKVLYLEAEPIARQMEADSSPLSAFMFLYVSSDLTGSKGEYHNRFCAQVSTCTNLISVQFVSFHILPCNMTT